MLFKQIFGLIVVLVVALGLVSATSPTRRPESACKPKLSACDPDVQNYQPPGLIRPRYVCKRECACLAEKHDTKGFQNARCCTFIQCPLNPGYDTTEFNNFKKSVCAIQNPSSSQGKRAPQVEELQSDENQTEKPQGDIEQSVEE